MRLRSVISLLFCVWFVSFFPGLPRAMAQQSADYRADLLRWDSARIAALTAPNGWVNLAGLFWLDEGENTFGSLSSNKLVFPAGKIAPVAGTLVLREGQVQLVTRDTAVRVEGKFLPESLVYGGGLKQITTMQYGSLRWTIIRRGNLYGVRLRDLQHPNLEKLSRIDRYPVDERWKVKAVLKTDGNNRRIAIQNVLGQVNQLRSPGTLHFSLNGKAYSLDALEEEGKLFIIFGDRTNGDSTYPSGRFLYAVIPGPDGITELDFNKAYNPPCAFTPYATCPIPPVQNRLPLEIRAGEQQVHLLLD